MLNYATLFRILHKNKINFYTGVPDSVLKGLNFYLKKIKYKNHLITANEGAAIGLAVGNYLKSKRPSCVYMQNSGLPNAFNPLASILNSKIYKVPMVLLIGWRGAPGLKDEPQHELIGSITKKILKDLKITSFIINNMNDLKKIEAKLNENLKNKKISAILVRNGVFNNETKNKKLKRVKKVFSRDIFLKVFLRKISRKSLVFTSTGYISRSAYKISDNKNIFYNVGAMGHTQMIALGASNFTNKKVVCLDGDGSLIMHMGSIVNLANSNKNINYFLLNNLMHESVGGQECLSSKINFRLFSKSIGFKKYFEIKDTNNIEKKIQEILSYKTPTFINVLIGESDNKNLPRIKNFKKIQKNFMNYEL